MPGDPFGRATSVWVVEQYVGEHDVRGWRERVIGTSHLGFGTVRVAEVDAEWRQVELRRWGYERDPSVGEALASP